MALVSPGPGGEGLGAIDIGNGALVLLDSETLNNAIVTIGSHGNPGFVELYGSSSTEAQTLTLGSSLTLVQAGSLVSFFGPQSRRGGVHQSG